MALWDVTTANSSLVFDPDAEAGSGLFAVQVDTNHYLALWSGIANDGYAQVITVNTTTWAVTTAAASLEFDTQNGRHPAAVQIDTNHFIVLWSSASSSVTAQVLTVNTTTWAVTTAAGRLNSISNGDAMTRIVRVDTNHFLGMFSDAFSDGFVQVFTVNTSTWEVTTAAASLEWETATYNQGNLFAVDTNHFLIIWQGVSADGFAQILTVNTTTWAVTTAAAEFEFDTTNAKAMNAVMVDSNHFAVWWGGEGEDGYTQVLTINTTTWAITTEGTPLEYDTQRGDSGRPWFIMGTKYINWWGGGVGTTGYVQVFNVNTTTWAVTTASPSLNFATQVIDEGSLASWKIDTSHYINFWKNTSIGGDATVQVFAVEVPTTIDISVSDTVTVSESVSMNRLNFINVNDAITVTDFPGYAPELVIVTEYVELLIFTGTIEPSVNDAITVSESIALEINLPDISVNDEVAISEATMFDFVRDMAVNDAITVSESIAVEIANLAGIVVNDAITVSENVSVKIDLGNIVVNDAVTVAETVDPDLQTFLDLSDNVSVSESVNLELFSFISVNDAVAVTDVPTLEHLFNISVNEAITVSETVTGQLQHDLSFGPPVGVGTDIYNHIPTTRNYS